MKLKLFRPLLALITTAALVACGGGGGDNAPTVTFPSGIRTGTASAGANVDTANLDAVSTEAVEALLSTIGGDQALSQPLGASRARAASLGKWAARQAASRVGSSARAKALAVASETFACTVSGTLTVTVNDADNNNVLTAGDAATFAFTNCVEQTGAPAINGSFSMSFNVLLLDAQQNPTAFDATVSMNALSVQGLGSLDGSARLWVAPVPGGERSFVRYQAMQSLSGATLAVLDFDVDQTTTATTSTSQLNGTVQLGGEVYVMAQLSAFDTTAGDPASGQLRITDAQGDRLLLTARGTLVDRDFFYVTNGTATPDASIVGTPWSAFRQ